MLMYVHSTWVTKSSPGAVPCSALTQIQQSLTCLRISLCDHDAQMQLTDKMQVGNSVLSLQAQGVDGSLPVQSSWESFADGFESFLEANFQEDKMQPVAQEQPITRRIPTAKRFARTRKADVVPVPRPRPLTREQRRRLHNRASQRQWRERQKVGTLHARI